MFPSHITAQSEALNLPDPIRLILALAAVAIIAQAIRWGMTRFELNLVSGNLAVNVLTGVVAVLLAVRPEHLHSLETLATIFMVALAAAGMYGAVASYKARPAPPTQADIFTALNSQAASAIMNPHAAVTTRPPLPPIQPVRKEPPVTQPPLRPNHAVRNQTPVQPVRDEARIQSVRKEPPVDAVYERQRGDEPAMKMQPSHVLAGNDPTQNSRFPIPKSSSSPSWLPHGSAWEGARPRELAPPSRRPMRIDSVVANAHQILKSIQASLLQVSSDVRSGAIALSPQQTRDLQIANTAAGYADRAEKAYQAGAEGESGVLTAAIGAAQTAFQFSQASWRRAGEAACRTPLD